MFRNKTLGIAAAATFGLAAMLGSTSAHALKIFDTAPADRATLTNAMDNGSVTYASETLLSAMVTAVDGDSTTYFNVGGAGTLVLSVPADVGANEDDSYIVTLTLDGMVFRTAPTIATTDGTGSPTFNVATGGTAGEKVVVFRLTGGGLSATASNLDISASYAVSSGGGSATVTLTNQTLAGLNIPGVSGTAAHGPANVIKIASALKETPTTQDLTASVEASFKKFAGGMTVGHLGSITVGFNAYRVATEGNGNVAVDDLTDILDNGQTTVGTTTSPNSTVSFMGDFSFASKVFAHGDSDCGAPDPNTPAQGIGADEDLATAETDIRVMEGEGDDAVVTGTTSAVDLDSTPTDRSDALASFVGYLCIMVQGDDTDDKDAPRIPDTDAYTAMASYKAIAGAASGPMGMERNLGEINRDGTTVHMPFLTTHERYSQRLRLVNRSSAPAMYEIEFHGADDTAGDMATGTLDANSVTVLNLHDGMVVTPGSGNATSGTLIVEAQASSIDVATIQTNRELGTTDTVVYTAAP